MEVLFPSREEYRAAQLQQVRALLAAVVPANPFQTRKLKANGSLGSIETLAEFSQQVPLTTKDELVEDQEQNPPYGSNLTFPLERYIRCHATSGTSGHPLRWLDTAESWAGMVRAWSDVYGAAGLRPSDCVFVAFSFGPFIGFWLAFEAAAQLGALCLPGGGLSSAARLRVMRENHATVLCCTPTYAIRLADVAATERIDLRESQVRLLIVAGEPGGSIPSTRTRLEELWPHARIFDHHGMTEAGPVTFECPDRPGVLHVMEKYFYPEVIDPQSNRTVNPGSVGELVLTNLARTGSPLFRYRTGDLVKASDAAICPCGRAELALEGGILGRTDDMITVRGVNVYPSAIEGIVRRFNDVAEYQVSVTQAGPLAELTLDVEPVPTCSDSRNLARRLESAFQSILHLRIPVRLADVGSLPRFELKATRWQKLPPGQ